MSARNNSQNAALPAILAAIVAIGADVAAMRDDIAALRDDVSALRNDVSALGENQTRDITELNERLDQALSGDHGAVNNTGINSDFNQGKVLHDMLWFWSDWEYRNLCINIPFLLELPLQPATPMDPVLSGADLRMRDVLSRFTRPGYIADLVLNNNRRGARSYRQTTCRNDVVASMTSEFVGNFPGEEVPSFYVGKKAIILECVRHYFRDSGVARIAGETAEEERLRLEKNANDRYDMTQIAISRFVRIQFHGSPDDFRFTFLSVQDRYILELVIEDFVVLCLPEETNGLPLHLAADSWMVRAMVTLQLRNFLRNRRGQGAASVVSVDKTVRSYN